MDDLHLKDPDGAARAIEMFLFASMGRAQGVVLALEGGLDAALVMLLAVRALGPQRVLALALPDGETVEGEGLRDAVDWAGRLEVPVRRVPLGAPLRAFGQAPLGDPQGGPARQPKALGNLKARLRMAASYAVANVERRLVLGSLNRSAWLLGYFTKYGDALGDLLPLGGLYATQVGQLARHLQLPIPLLERPRSAGLWRGQTDAHELGAGYDALDPVLSALADAPRPPAALARQLGVETALVEAVARRMAENAHKRASPPSPDTEGA
jgi:NAD+ synthase